MRKKSTTCLISVCCLIVFISLVAASELAEITNSYVGASRCKKCHQRDKIYQSWSKSKHAAAWEHLSEKNRKNEECISCHTSGKNLFGELLTGVQCEACHGPGKDHKKLLLAESKEKAEKEGLAFIDENICKKCHNENIPKKFRPEEPFDFEKAKAKGIHDVPDSHGNGLMEHQE